MRYPVFQFFVIVLLFANFLQGAMILSNEADLETSLQNISDGVVALAAEIAALKSQPGPVSQDQLDALVAKANVIVAAITAAQ